MEMLRPEADTIRKRLQDSGVGSVKIPQMVRIIGVPGIGKTDLFSHFKSDTYIKIKEPVSANPFLADGYRAPARWTFTLGVHMLTEQFMDHNIALGDSVRGDKIIIHKGDRPKPIVSDYGEPRCFAQVFFNEGVICKREFIEFIKLAHILDNVIPGLVLFLSGCEIAHARAKMRGRAPDKLVSLDWYRKLEEIYRTRVQAYVQQFNVPCFNVQWEEGTPLDPVNQVLKGAGFPEIKPDLAKCHKCGVPRCEHAGSDHIFGREGG